MTETYEVTTTVPITSQQIADLVVTVIEGGSGDWCRMIDIPGEGGHERYSAASVYEKEFSWKVKAYDHPGGHLNPGNIRRGLQLLAEQYPTTFNDIAGVEGSYDAEDADMWFQLCIYGEIVFG